MDVRELWDDPDELYRVLLDSLRKQIETAGPAIVQTSTTDGHRVGVAPAIKMRVRAPDGSISYSQIATISNAPIRFTGGGGADNTSTVHTHPVVEGDEGILFVGSRDIDNWKTQGGVQQPANPARMHSLSDTFFIPGVRSDPRKIKNYNRKDFAEPLGRWQALS